MIEIDERFPVAASPATVYGVLSDPDAVVECIEGAALGERHDDGTFDGTLTVRFSALRVQFAGRVRLDLDEAASRGTVTAQGRDRQGATRFKAVASFTVTPGPEGDSSVVHAAGEIDLSGKLASMIANAASTVVKRMTAEFVDALAVRCASTSTQLAAGSGAAAAPAPRPGERGPAAPAGPGVLLLHGLAGAPVNLRGWGDAFAAAGFGVSIPCLPGHGTRWPDLGRVGWGDWVTAADGALDDLAASHDRLVVVGISLGATLAVRLAELHPDRVAGAVAVDPMWTGVRGIGPLRLLAGGLLRSRGVAPARAPAGRGTDADAAAVGYHRIPIAAVRPVRALGRATVADLARLTAPLLVAERGNGRLVRRGDGDRFWQRVGAAPHDGARNRRWDFEGVAESELGRALAAAALDFVQSGDSRLQGRSS
ncbi:MAG TPA: alpha/beta fold hydrolase [Acidimicrobiales bacterium]